MTHFDARGLPLSGATPTALPLYERALDAFVSWRSGADLLLDEALSHAPAFVMAQVLKAHLLTGSRDPRRVRAARPLVAAAARWPANEQERLHLAALSAVLEDDYERAARLIGCALQARPRDVLALAIGCGLDYLVGDVEGMRARIQGVLPHWPRDLPTFHGVQAMHAFALAECGEADRAEDAARAALQLDDGDARAHHAMAHAFEMSDRPDAGVRWLVGHVHRWGAPTVVANHCAWHLALFQLALGNDDAALNLYDRRLRAGGVLELSDLIDASALLWRLRLRGHDMGPRWAELAEGWAPHIDDAFCSFSDVHAMLAFVGARDWERARRLEQVLIRSQHLGSRHGRSTRQLGLTACRGLMAFGRGDLPLALSLLAGLPAQAHRLGGSHAQRDVMHLTLLSAVEAMRRPHRRHGVARAPVARHATQETRQALARHAIAMPAA